MKGRSFPFKGIIAYPPVSRPDLLFFGFCFLFVTLEGSVKCMFGLFIRSFLYIYFFGSPGWVQARPKGAHTKSKRRADGARKKRCAILLMRGKELFQPDARSDFQHLGPGLRPGRCGWVGSPEGVGRGSRNTLPPPLAQRSDKTNKKAPVSGRSARLYNFCENEF